MLDLLLKNAKLDTLEATSDIAVRNGVIDTIASNITEVAQTIFDAEGFFLCSGFYEGHIHLESAPAVWSRWR